MGMSQIPVNTFYLNNVNLEWTFLASKREQQEALIRHYNCWVGRNVIKKVLLRKKAIMSVILL